MPHAATDVTSLNQEAMRLAQLVHERSPRFHIVAALELAEAPDHGCLSEAVADLWQRHDAFRTGFLQAFDARPEAIHSVVAARMTDPVGSVEQSLFTRRVHPRAPSEVLRYQLAHLADDAAERALGATHQGTRRRALRCRMSPHSCVWFRRPCRAAATCW